MPVFTILNCGTNYDRSRRGELIADFGAQMQGVEYQTFLITDGVGAEGTRANPMPGTFDPFTQTKKAKGKGPSWSKTPMQTLQNVSQNKDKFSPTGHGFLRAITSNTGSKNAAITGHGWDDNIRHAIATISAVFPTLTGTINMIGWSRGAVTCLRMANWIKEFLGAGFDINIFAVDPVAGLDAGERLQDTYFIPDIVKNYIGILALDEMRGDFKPQDLARIQVQSITTNVAFLPFPGVHNTPVTIKDNSLPEVTRMVRFLAYRFLCYHQTQFTINEVQYSHTEACRMYAEIMLKRDRYAGLFERGFKPKQMGGYIERTVRQDVQNYVGADSHFFVNEHHRGCFEAAYPEIYKYFFTTRLGPFNANDTKNYPAAGDWGQKFQQFSQDDPTSSRLLSQVYTFEHQQAAWTVSSHGVGATLIPTYPSVTAVMHTLL